MSEENQNVTGFINAMVEYQAGTIVSRVIHKGKNGNITLFAFDKDQELTEHTSPYDALVQVIDGEATITIDGKSNTLRAGQIIIMPADIPHALFASARFKMLLTMIKG